MKNKDKEPEFKSSSEADMVAFQTPYIDEHEAAVRHSRAGEGRRFRRRRGFWARLMGIFQRTS